MNTKEAAKSWGISDRRVRILCQQGKVEGAYLQGKTWILPDGAKKPSDGRESIPSYLKTIEGLKAQLDSKRPLTPAEAKALNDEFAVEYTYDSNAIEGNTLTLRETDMVLRGLTVDKKPLKDHLEAVGHKEAFDYVCSLVQKREPLSAWTIRQIHSLVLMDRPEDKGVYRRIPVRISGAKTVPVEPALIPEKMDDLISWYNGEKDDDFLTKLALLHLGFESIHPFIDGNGRTGRLVVNLELMKLGYPPIDIKFTDRKAYYDAFDKYASTGSPNAMARLFARYLSQRLRRYLSILG
jgi:Fic family protein